GFVSSRFKSIFLRLHSPGRLPSLGIAVNKTLCLPSRKDIGTMWRSGQGTRILRRIDTLA
ncbi:MAG: hypothetical protein Q8N45_12275, partial [Anaerolineales bacterium]|nr:hypothetical protein [Anaerolineales bacterium]